MVLDLTSLRKAVASLGRAVERSRSDPADEEVRDAVIQRFEYTYELCWKMLKRHLEQIAASPAEIDQMSFKELIRDAAERGLVPLVEPWFEYRGQRNRTSHAYDADAARSVHETALAFLGDARALLAELERRNAG
jgi:nucleotidyltransferase substrate binding protein (TIGR01987 family)